ncbi:hypothetical protein B0H14DRAFT_2612093 [Mycena olivaceomarginata]|nr:hypothetical protein B0H14DRAFT_2612093 [Mycena olivaceomarginata]
MPRGRGGGSRSDSLTQRVTDAFLREAAQDLGEKPPQDLKLHAKNSRIKTSEKLIDPWGTIASFRNVEHLELTVSWPYDYKDWDSAAQAFASMDHPPLERAADGSTAGLPSQEICVIHLELALLDQPIGSSNDANERKNPPPGWKHIESEVDRDAWLDGEDEDTASDKDSDGEDFEHKECVAPRALPTLLDSGIDLATHFSSLIRLTFLRPAESLNPGLDMQDVYVSLKSDLAILSEWAALIHATRGTLEHLVLDQRPFAEEIETDATGDTEFLIHYPTGQDTSALWSIASPRFWRKPLSGPT